MLLHNLVDNVHDKIILSNAQVFLNWRLAKNHLNHEQEIETISDMTGYCVPWISPNGWTRHGPDVYLSFDQLSLHCFSPFNGSINLTTGHVSIMTGYINI